MAGFLPVSSSLHGLYEGDSSQYSPETQEDGGRWYLSRNEIEENSPSKRDGIDLKKETYLRKSYCTFLQDLGMRLKVPQVTIATAIIFCHRFFLRQSHAKNDRRAIATVCMFLAGKDEETPRPLKDVILVSYEIIHKKDPAAIQRIKQKEVYEQQKELVVVGERVVLSTLGFDLNVHHPYKPLVEAIKKFKVAQNALAQVAWNFVNDGLRTSLCLQFKPHHIAAGAIFLAAKFLKVKLPSDGEKVWWQEFDVTPRQLEEVSNQMLELYEQNRAQPSNEVDGSTEGGATPRAAPTKVPSSSEEHLKTNSQSQAGGSSSRSGTTKPSSSKPFSEQSNADYHGGPPRTMHGQSNENGSIEMKSSSHTADGEFKGNQSSGSEPLPYQDNMGKAQNLSKYRSESEQGHESNIGIYETKEVVEMKDKQITRNTESKEGPLGWSPQEVIKKIDRDKVKAALEKRRKSLGGISQKTELMDEDDLIERELEAGIELAAESERNKRERKQSWSKPPGRLDHENPHQEKHLRDDRDELYQGRDLNYIEEGEVSNLDDTGRGYQSPKQSSRKRKAGSPSDKWHHHVAGSHHHNKHFDHTEDGKSTGRFGHSERDRKRHIQENHV